MSKNELKGMKRPVLGDDGRWTYEFGNSDATKPSIRIHSVCIDRSSDVFNPQKNYIGLMIYARNGKSSFTLNNINCQAGDVFHKRRRPDRKKYIKKRRT